MSSIKPTSRGHRPVEREVKARVQDPSVIRKTLIRMRALSVGEFDQEDTYFDTGDRSRALRLRLVNDGSWILTYKGPRPPGPVKEREELECKIADGRVLSRIIDRLGFRVIRSFKKHRTVYRLDDLEVSIDRVDGLGDFVEIEAKGPDVTTERILGLVSELQLRDSDIVSETYLEMLEKRESARKTSS